MPLDGEGANFVINRIGLFPAGTHVAINLPLFGTLVTPTDTTPVSAPSGMLTQSWRPADRPQLEGPAAPTAPTAPIKPKSATTNNAYRAGVKNLIRPPFLVRQDSSLATTLAPDSSQVKASAVRASRTLAEPRVCRALKRGLPRHYTSAWQARRAATAHPGQARKSRARRSPPLTRSCRRPRDDEYDWQARQAEQGRERECFALNKEDADAARAFGSLLELPGRGDHRHVTDHEWLADGLAQKIAADASAEADVDDRKLWRAVNPASFVTTEALRKQRNSPSMSRSTFARLHLNAWVAPDVDRWIKTDAWERLAGEVEIPENASVFVGADGSRSYDTTAVAWAAKHPDGRIDVDARIFSVRDDVPHHVWHGGGTIDFGDVEGFLFELASRFDVQEVRFDPRFLERSVEVFADRLPGSAVAPVEPYTNAHRHALAGLERAVLEGTLRHRGDPAISQQVLASAADRFDNGDVRRLRKLDRTRPIDAAVALALAVQGVTIEPTGSVYETRGMIVI